MLVIKTKLDNSQIHGIGLFTLEKVMKGQIIGQLCELDVKIEKKIYHQNILICLNFILVSKVILTKHILII
jgi:hypothetical protein